MYEEGVQEFYSGQTVFLTGATGFVGRVITEKLLRTCPDVTRIYLFIRPKKGKDSQERIDELFDNLVFEPMKKENPDFKSKVYLIAGDLSLPDIGISESDRKTLIDEVTVMFHGGATVRFDAKLKTAININISGTKEILQICSECKNLKALVHISTAYTNCDRDEVDEIIYPPPINAETIINIAKYMPDEILERCTETIIQGWPNTYTFTKQIGEDLVKSEAIAKNIPAAIYRPAIVVGAYNEPIPGWIDNIYGPTGALAGMGLGLIRTMLGDESLKAELVPIDLTVNAAFAIAWDVARLPRNGANENEMTRETFPVYNFVTTKENPFKWCDNRALLVQTCYNIPSVKNIWYTYTITTKHWALYYLYRFVLHLLPAFLIDCAFLIIGRKPRALDIYRKVHKFIDAMAYFSTREWTFRNDNVIKLWKKLSKEDKILFNFDMSTLDWKRHFVNNVKGIRYYIAKDSFDTVPAARRRLFKLYILHLMSIAVFFSILIWLFLTPISATLNWTWNLLFPMSETLSRGM